MEEQDTKKKRTIATVLVILAGAIAVAYTIGLVLTPDSSEPLDTMNFTNITLSQTSCTERLFNISYAHNHSQCFEFSCESINASWIGSFNPQRNIVRCAANNSSVEVQINSSRISICEMLERDIRDYINCSQQ